MKSHPFTSSRLGVSTFWVVFVRVCDTGRQTSVCSAWRERTGVAAKFATFYEGFATNIFAKRYARVDETSTSTSRIFL